VQQALIEMFVMNISVTLRQKRLEDDQPDERAAVSPHELAVGLFFRLIRSGEELGERVAKGEQISLKRGRTLIQLAVDTFIEDEAALIALTRVKNHHGYLANHMTNACLYALSLGNRIGLTRRQLLDLGTAGLVYDIGMFLVPREVRDKAETLTADEREMIMQHPLRGADALLRAQETGEANRICAIVAAEHHLVGYPRAVQGRPNLFTAIMAIADAYDALTTDRPFRPSLSHGEALKILYGGAGGHDRLLVKAFANVIGLYPAGVLVELDSGEIAVVAQQSSDPRMGLRPRVKIVVDASGSSVEGTIIDLVETHGDGRFRRSIRRVIELDGGKVGTSDLLSLI
jgi:HD-GYP domain-containing protein (c-di-GMP phosphodiesterase class II)